MMRFTRLPIKTFLAVTITTQFFLFTIDKAFGQEPKPDVPKIIRKSGGVLQGSAINRVEPAYPPLAKAAEISGPVVVEVTVDEEGKVISARAISGHPLLKDAAVAAARQWTFTPTMLSGVLVKVIGTITFNFYLGERPAQTDSPPAEGAGVPGSIPGSVVRVAPDRDRQQGRMTPDSEGLLAMLEQSGFRYSKVSEGVWEIEATGKNFREFNIRVTMAEELVLLMVKLADRKDVAVKNELLVKLLELNHRFDMARVALSDEMLYARIDLHARVVDGAEFNYAVEQLARATNEIYPELKSSVSTLQTLPGVASQREAVIKPPVLSVPGPEPVQPPAPGDAPAVASSVDSRPVALNAPKPSYTREARRNGVQGLVRLRVLVGPDGMVKQAKVMQTLPDGLGEEALKAAFKIRFKPAMKDGKAVSFWVGVDVEFNLRDNPNQ